jgi:hypothetical protein
MTRQTIILFLIAILISACGTELEGCILPPEDYSESDLIGTWQGRYLEDTDTLIIREDGLYKQILDAPTRDFYYESEWLPWRITETLNGIQYLYFEDMRMCVYYSREACEVPDQGVHSWRDLCNDRNMITPGNGVLMVLGTNERYKQPPRGIVLVSLSAETYHSVGYELVEP